MADIKFAQPSATPRALVIDRGWRAIAVGLLFGALLAVAWSYRLVDEVIGQSVARELLRQDAADVSLVNTFGAMFFALATGIAGSFTACNIAALCAVSPMAVQSLDSGQRLRAAARTMGLVAIGATGVAGAYGAVGAVFGPEIPQLSKAQIGDGFPVRLLQSVIVFGVIGIVMVTVAVLTVSKRRPAALTKFAQSSWALVSVGGAHRTVPHRSALLNVYAVVRICSSDP